MGFQPTLRNHRSHPAAGLLWSLCWSWTQQLLSKNEARLSPRTPPPQKKNSWGKRGWWWWWWWWWCFLHILLYGGGYDGVMCSKSKMEGVRGLEVGGLEVMLYIFQCLSDCSISRSSQRPCLGAPKPYPTCHFSLRRSTGGWLSWHRMSVSVSKTWSKVQFAYLHW